MHCENEWVRAGVHTNSIEGFWSHLKRSIYGTFHSVPKKHLQKYVVEIFYRCNLRKSDQPISLALSSRLSQRIA
jgi:transposase